MSDAAQQAVMGQEDPKGLALYRRKRPYQISDPQKTDASAWDVMDLLTGEQLGRIVRVQKDDDESYRIDLASQIGGDTNGLDQTYPTRWLAADVIWKKALPIRSSVWRLLKVGVHAMDWTTRMFAIVVAFLFHMDTVSSGGVYGKQ